MLLLGAHTFAVDAERLVLNPISEMMALVQRVSDDPSCPVELDHDEATGELKSLRMKVQLRKVKDVPPSSSTTTRQPVG